MSRRNWLIIFAVLFSVFFGSLLYNQSVYAVGVGVKPKEIDLNVRVGQQVATEILVINISKEPALYSVSADALEDDIIISPQDFKLEADTNRLVTISVKMKTPGRFATNISVVARPLGAGGLTAASGVKLPLTITASGFPGWW